MKNAIILLALLLSACAPVQSILATNAVYVSPSGSDNNSGTFAAPYKTIAQAMTLAPAGYVIYVRAGVYPVFTVSKSGIILAGYEGERPIIRGPGLVRISGSGISFSNFEITAGTSNWQGALYVTGSSNIIANNYVHDNIATGTVGIFIMGSNNQILRNEVFNNTFVGIRIYGSTAKNNLVDGNLVYNHTISAANSDGIDCDGAASANTYRNNIVHDNSDDGIDMWNCTNNTVSGNIVYHNGGTGDGNGIKLGQGGLNIATSNTSYNNYTCGFTSNGAGNSYASNVAYANGTCGFDDGWRISGNTQTSSFVNNLAYDNPKNFPTSKQYITVFSGNSEVPPVTITPGGVTSTPTATSTQVFTPTTTQTIFPTPTKTGTPVIACDPAYVPLKVCIYKLP